MEFPGLPSFSPGMNGGADEDIFDTGPGAAAKPPPGFEVGLCCAQMNTSALGIWSVMVLPQVQSCTDPFRFGYQPRANTARFRQLNRPAGNFVSLPGEFIDYKASMITDEDPLRGLLFY